MKKLLIFKISKQRSLDYLAADSGGALTIRQSDPRIELSVIFDLVCQISQHRDHSCSLSDDIR